MCTELDLDARYTVDGWRGIAFYVTGYVQHDDLMEFVDDDGNPTGEVEPTGLTYDDPNMVIAIMVGDDREHIVDVADLTKLSDDEYCPVCGQIGCKAYQ